MVTAHFAYLLTHAIARTYALASNLPSLLLDALLNLPAFLVSIRNAMLPVPPRLPYPPPVPPASTTIPPTQLRQKPNVESPPDSDPDVRSDTGSDADVESGAEGSGVGESWISLKKDEHP